MTSRVTKFWALASSARRRIGELASFEQAKLAVLVRMMSKINKKWRARVKLGKASMSAVLGEGT